MMTTTTTTTTAMTMKMTSSCTSRTESDQFNGHQVMGNRGRHNRKIITPEYLLALKPNTIIK